MWIGAEICKKEELPIFVVLTGYCTDPSSGLSVTIVKSYYYKDNLKTRTFSRD